MNSQEIRSKLKNGTTINQVCTEYKISFKTLVRLMSRLGRDYETPQDTNTGELYITYKRGRFNVNKGNTYFGGYYTLDDAVRVRDWFIFHRWDKRWIDRACKETGVSRCQR